MSADPDIKAGGVFTIIPDRLAELQQATIHVGHGETLSEACTTDWAGYLVGGDTLTDTPPCTDERLARLVHGINDGIHDDAVRTEKGRRLAPLLVGTAGREDEITALLDRLAAKRLRTIVLPLASSWPESDREVAVSAIEGVCDALEGDGDLSTAVRLARSAAESAWSEVEVAAWYPARAAARSAALAAESAAGVARSEVVGAAARSAARSARLAALAALAAPSAALARSEAESARSAVRSTEADLLIAELEAFHAV